MKNTILIPVCIMAALVIIPAVFLLVGAITDYRPEKREILSVAHGDRLPDTVRIMTWNIGYGGLGDNMDFFYDGGRKVRDSRERTMENLGAIVGEIRRSGCDIILLQEADEDSKRTYRINEVALLKREFPEYHVFMAYNYKSFFVPIPLRSPIGKVAGGQIIMSRYMPEEVARWQYPSRFPWPVSMFNLKRCLMTASFDYGSGKAVVIGNTHNTAYDTGNMRKEEMEFLAGTVEDMRLSGKSVIIGGDWNQYPEGYIPDRKESEGLAFSTAAIDDENIGKYGSFFYDNRAKTLRHLNIPYGPQSVLTVTDYFFVSDDIEVINTETTDLGFRNSDHNPVIISIALNKNRPVSRKGE